MPFIAANESNSTEQANVPSGTLRHRPSEHLVLYAAERALSGTLWFHHAARGNVTIVFSRGMVWKVRSDHPLPLGELAYELGVASRRVVDEAMATAARDRRLLGEVFVARNMLEPIEVQRLLAAQLERKVASALSYPDETVWCFYPGEDALYGYGGDDWPRVHPHGAVWQHVAANAQDASVKAILSRFVGKRLGLHMDVCSRFGFTEGELARVEALRGGVDITPALLRDTRSPTARLVYVLLLARALVPQGLSIPPAPRSESGMPAANQSGTLVAMGRPPSFSMPRTRSQPPSMPPALPPTVGTTMMPPATSSAVPPSRGSVRVPSRGSGAAPSLLPPTMVAPLSATQSLSSSTGARRRLESEPEVQRPRTASELDAWIRDLDDNLARNNHYELLGIPQDSTSEAIRAAFMRHSRELRPERLPPEVAALRLPAARVLQRMGVAYRMLVDRNARRIYDERLRPMSKPRSSAPPPADRRELAQIIDRKLERGEIESAERLCRRTIDAAPGDVEALALLAWVRSHDERNRTPPIIQTLIGQLDEAVEAAPESALVYFCRGRFHKRRGSSVQAMRDFMKVVELDPRHVDAERELRLYRARRAQDI